MTTTAPPPEPRQFITPSEAAARAEASRRWVFDKLADGTLTRYKSAKDKRLTLIDRAELDALIGDIRPAA